MFECATKHTIFLPLFVVTANTNFRQATKTHTTTTHAQQQGHRATLRHLDDLRSSSVYAIAKSSDNISLDIFVVGGFKGHRRAP